jgi:Tfp pilus assembly protein PilF
MLLRLCHFVCLLCLAAGCATLQTTKPQGYQTSYEQTYGSTSEAIAKHRAALKRLDKCDLCGAEELLKASLAEDEKFGLAHNTLGNVYFDQGKFYPAAWEFEYAARMMPDRPEPINNLGLVFEQVGRFDDAIVQFELAYGMDETNAAYLGNLIRARMRRGDQTCDMVDLLHRLVEIDSRTEWVAWANGHLHTGPFGKMALPQIIDSEWPTVDEGSDGRRPDAEELPIPIESPESVQPAADGNENENGDKLD